MQAQFLVLNEKIYCEYFSRSNYEDFLGADSYG